MLHIPKKGLFSGLLFAGSRDLSLECSVYRNTCLRPWAGLSQFEQLVYVSNLFMVNICFFSGAGRGGASTCLHDQSPIKTLDSEALVSSLVGNNSHVLSHILPGEWSKPYVTPLWGTFERQHLVSSRVFTPCAFSLCRFYFPSFCYNQLHLEA